MKYENFYTDISYLPIFKRPARAALVPILKRHPCLLNKILFGTDWYMILSTNNRYSRWFTQVIRALQQVQDQLTGPQFRPGLNLFHQSAIVNPVRFYRFDDHGERMIENYRRHIEVTFGGQRRKREKALERLDERGAAFRALYSLIDPIRSKLAAEPYGVPELAFTGYRRQGDHP